MGWEKAILMNEKGEKYLVVVLKKLYILVVLSKRIKTDVPEKMWN
jgi:hypothetical protein